MHSSVKVKEDYNGFDKDNNFSDDDEFDESDQDSQNAAVFSSDDENMPAIASLEKGGSTAYQNPLDMIEEVKNRKAPVVKYNPSQTVSQKNAPASHMYYNSNEG